MNYSILIGALLALLSTSVTAVDRVHSSPTDAGVINQERILYWLEKRGEVAANASAEQKAAAIKAYLAKKSYGKPVVPGALGKKVAIAESLSKVNRQSTHKSSLLSAKAAPLTMNVTRNDVEMTVKVLAIMVDFPDLKHDENDDIDDQDVSQQHYEELLYSTDRPTGISAYQYYQQESGGTFYFTGEAHGWVTAENNAAHYGGNDPDNNDNDMDVPALVTEAVTKAVSELNIDLSEFDKTDLFDIDNDNIINEPDGIIDHVMIFHSSVGEEAGGGSLGEDAIWSHRFFVFDEQNQPVSIPGSDIKLYGYTINPIDAKTGVVVHEFGHDLGLDDEYNTNNGPIGSPVGDWSLMASGTWVDGGRAPSSFSPLALDYFSERYQGNWINQQALDFVDLNSESVDLVHANNHDGGINQVKVDIGGSALPFFAPFAGDYQYYSGSGDEKDLRLAFDVTLPTEASTLTMTAHWKIEQDWDYLQVLVNGTAIAGNHTKANNAHWDVTHFISGNSSDIEGAQGEPAWVELSFDLAGYENQTVTIELAYITDQAVGDYGFAVDNIEVTANDSSIFSSDAEQANQVTLNGFSRISDSIEGESRYYYMQLRSYQGNDSMLAGEGYDHGVVLWYRDDNVTNNKVDVHPGEVFIGVVDADQNLIKSGSTIRGTYTQLRDAAFSKYTQSSFNSDNHLTNNDTFSDKDDYSSPAQPESGINLPTLGLVMEVVTQEANSLQANISIAKQDIADVSVTQDGLTVNLSIDDPEYSEGTEVTWNVGDGTELQGSTVSHTYGAAGNYTITAMYSTNSGNKTIDKSVVVGEKVMADITANVSGKHVSFSANVNGGFGDFTYRWDFGDGTDVSKSLSPEHEYSTEGTYTVTLAITDDTMQTYTFTSEVTISDVEPLSVSFTSTSSNLNVTFQSAVSGGDSTYTYAWDFGDGNSSTDANPSHTYASAGSYSVTLTVTDGAGSTDEVTRSVTVSAAVVTQPSKSSSSGGGSFGYFALMLLGVLRLSRK